MIEAPDVGRDAPAFCVYHGPGTRPAAFAELQVGASEGSGGSNAHGRVSTRSPRVARWPHVRWRPADELFRQGGTGIEPAVLLVDASMLERIGKLPPYVIIVAADRASETALGSRAHLSVVGLRGTTARLRVLRAAGMLSAARLTAVRRGCALAHAREEVHEINQIGMSLMEERDLSVLLHRILEQSKRLTKSDAGALMLIEKDEHGKPRLRMTLYHIDSLTNLPDLGAITYAVDSTNAIGHAVVVGEPVVIADAYDLPPDAPYFVEKWFDLQYGYRTRSMLVAPMVDRRNDVVGVLVLLNRKTEPGAKITSKAAADRYVRPYTGRVVRLARALASQAAVCIENTQLHGQVQHLLESFVKAAASAIDERDPTTAGHSVRVAALTTALAAAVEHEDRGPYKSVRFTRAEMRELKFAALLHDLGKLGVREDVLTKAKKLPPNLWERVQARFTLIRQSMQLEHEKKLARLTSEGAAPALTQRLDEVFGEELQELELAWTIVRSANEPTPFPETPDPELIEIARHTFEGTDGTMLPYLTQEELRFLQIPYGTLDPMERAEVESHVDQTFRFLAQIPWTDDLKNMPRYAGMHHEKLNGSGYPRRIKDKEIPIQARMLAIADIFDALTESDRPYKRAVAPEEALAVLQSEASAGLLDPELVRIMAESQCYKKILEEDWHRL